jgi:predicted nucleic acid-binding protein
VAWVVDTCVLLDVLENDPMFGRSSADLLEALAPKGLTLCPITYVELAPAFEGDISLQDEFLREIGLDFREGWHREDTLAAHLAWQGYVVRKRAGQTSKRPIADILIGAFALRHQGLVTRNVKDFATIFPSLALEAPSV